KITLCLLLLGGSLMTGFPLAQQTNGNGSEFSDHPVPNQLIGSWQWPSSTQQIIRPFIVPAKITDPQHRGLDIAAAPATQLRSPSAGTVLFSGRVAERSVLTIDHGMGLVSTFDPIMTELRTGDPV